MICCITELCRKDVIDVATGNRIGYVADVDVETCSGQVAALCVKKDCLFSLKPPPPIKVSWCDIVVIGEETVLVKNVCFPASPAKGKKGIGALLGK